MKVNMKKILQTSIFAALLTALSGRPDPLWTSLNEMGIVVAITFMDVAKDEPFVAIVSQPDRSRDLQRLLLVSDADGTPLLDAEISGDKFCKMDLAELDASDHDLLVTEWDVGVHSKTLRVYDVHSGRLLRKWTNESTIDWEVRRGKLVVRLYPLLAPRDGRDGVRQEIWDGVSSPESK